MVNGQVVQDLKHRTPHVVQIHHNGRDQWVMSIQIENGDIYFLDSLGLKINTSLEFQLCKSVNKKDENVKFDNNLNKQSF